MINENKSEIKDSSEQNFFDNYYPFNDSNYINDNNMISIDEPEIGTKIEKNNFIFQTELNLPQAKNNGEINNETKKENDFYDNKIKEMFFIPFFTMDEKIDSRRNVRYSLSYNDNNLLDIMLICIYEEGLTKIEINHKNIVQIIFDIKGDKINLFIFLKNPPKVYTKERIINKSYFYQEFEQNLLSFKYDNSYKNVDKINPNEYYKVRHVKKNDSLYKSLNDFINKLLEKKERFLFPFIPRINKIIKQKDKRETSFFSMDNEYLNLYLNDLVMKISFNNEEYNQIFCKYFIGNLRYLKVKVKNNKYYHQKIQSLNIEQQFNYRYTLVKGTQSFYENLKQLIPNLQYSIKSLLTVQQINIFNFDLKILEFLSVLKSNEQEQEKAAKIIEEMNKNNNYTDIILDIEKFKKDYLNKKENEKIDFDNNLNTKKITVTPSKIIYEIPSPKIYNHFQRKLEKYNDSIIKIKIVDDDHTIFRSKDINDSQNLYNFIKHVFLNGITIGFYKYNYIASSNSQLKKLGGWMINLEGIRILQKKKESINNNEKYSSVQLYKNCNEIMNIFGDFSEEKNTFKNTSRKGMIFTNSTFITNIDNNKVIPLEDEKNGKYIITDGIGMISQNLMDLVTEIMKKNKLNFSPISAIQIRFAGCKGVLALYPTLENHSICIRESQIKFRSNDTALNVCNISKYNETSLNRQFIMLLSTLGVKDWIFEKIENDIVKNYLDLLQFPNKIFLNQKSIYYEFKNRLIKFEHVFDEFLHNNINLMNEPLFSQFINVFIYSILMKMKYSGKIKDNKCFSLMGVIDETNTLEENEVYIHLLNNSENKKIDMILEQKVIVYRSPSLYPGDIKILKAINNPSLKHMVNVIVFSKKGKRPTFNKLSGGDLDGDSYIISYNNDIINNILEQNCEPLDDPKYSYKIEKNKNKKKITIEDSIDCMIKGIENSKTGIICNNHMAIADSSPLKAMDPRCIQLCKYFNKEIDSNKTGYFIDILTLKDHDLISLNKPDFLNKGVMNKKKCYESPGILGKLYRGINKNNELYDNFRINFFEKAIRRDYEIDIIFITKNCFGYLSDAYKIYNDYKIKFCNLMKKYNFCTEGEFFLNRLIFKEFRGYRGKDNSPTNEFKELLKYIEEQIIMAFKEINKDVASAIYIASYLNIRDVYEKTVYFTDDFEENIAKLLSLFEKEKKDLQKLFKDYREYANLKRNKNETKNKYKRIFSLPWIIKDINEKLFDIKSNNKDLLSILEF